VLGRACVLLILGFATLPGCTRDGGEEPGIAAPSAGIASIPSGAVGAVGVSFDLPAPPERDENPLLPHPKSKRSVPFDDGASGSDSRPERDSTGMPPAAPVPAPVNPFADPPSAPGHDEERPPPMHRRRGTSL
jgi:hypothetical protein